VLASPLFEYTLPIGVPPAKDDQRNCFPVFRSGERSINGYGCVKGRGVFYQLGTLFYDIFNSEGYVSANDINPRTLFLRELLKAYKINPQIAVGDAKARVVAFGRKVPDRPEFWVTVKNGSDSRQTVAVTIKEADPGKRYLVRDLLSSREETLTGQALSTEGFDASLSNLGSTVFWIAPVTDKAPGPPS
jgi:hypothetical protein